MPRRRRSSKRLDGPLTLDERTMWQLADLEELNEEFGSLAEAREEWARRRHLLIDPRFNHVPPESFWALDGPQHLAKLPAKALGVGCDSQEEARAALDAFESRRTAWLERQGVPWHEITATANGHTR